MVKIKLICIGSLKEKFLQEAFNEYKKRLGAFCKFELIELDEYTLKNNPSNAEIEMGLSVEAERIWFKTSANSYVVSLCIEGEQLSSEAFAQKIKEVSTYKASEITFVIGSSFGLADAVKKRSDCLLSMSKMTFPHQLARVLLCEQIYRAFQIASGGKYHK